MSHHIYETEAFILGSRSLGEANRLFYLFTPSLGLVLAVAQSARKAESKLRYNLTDYSLVKISLVKGREFWRIIGSETIIPVSIFSDREQERKLIVKIFSLLRRLLAGPEESQHLFYQLRRMVIFLLENTFINSQLHNLECIFLLKLLHHLGYLPESRNLGLYLLSDDWTEELVNNFTPYQLQAVKIINDFFEHYGA